ncbi:MAG: peptide chain release factor N(5)-glutamine methyltransferase [Ruminococcus sp.]|nr:peptide chain release factor N(5)-glutamine methyltransferase [Ruminococcus sp.]
MLKDAYRACKAALTAGGVEDAAFEARCMLEHLTGYSRSAQLAHSSDAFTQQAALDEMVRRRLLHEPLQYILGSWEFFGIPLCVGEGVLIPRDDTEVVLNLCLSGLKNQHDARGIDLCAGSGAIAIALALHAGIQMTAVELSDKAFYFLEKNINNLGAAVTAVRGDILRCHEDFADGAFDLIVSNPPYIRSGEIDSLQTEVQFEPRMALDGGSSGYDFYKAIVRNWSRKLKKGGMLAFELGEGQADTVRAMMAAQGFADIRTADDLGGIHRAIIGTML